MSVFARRSNGAIWRLWSGLVLVLGLTGVVHAGTAESSARIVMVLSDTSPAYREAADAFVAAVGGRYPVAVRFLGDLPENEKLALLDGRDLLVAVGVRALSELAGPSRGDAPLMPLLVPRAAARAAGDIDAPGAAVYIDQPPERSLAFAKLLLPRLDKVGMLVSGESQADMREFALAAEQAHVDLLVEKVAGPGEIPMALQRLLGRVDALLLVPDSVVVNENTVRHILIASYRRRTPVIGFSNGLTHAGAVASLVSEAAEIGRQGGLQARNWNPATGRIPFSRNASDFGMVFNRQVARSLGIDVPQNDRELADWRNRLQ